MRIDTLNLYSASLCSTRWSIEGYKREPRNDIREAIKELATYAGHRKERGLWDIKDIATVWDEIFWTGKKSTLSNHELSNKGLLKLKTLFFKLPESFIIYPNNDLVAYIDSSTVLASSADFIIGTEKELILWIYSDVSSDKLKKSIFPAAERHIIESSLIGGLGNKNLYVMIYFSEAESVRAERFYCIENNKAVKAITKMIANKIYYPSNSRWCINCKIKCWNNKEE